MCQELLWFYKTVYLKFKDGYKYSITNKTVLHYLSVYCSVKITLSLVFSVCKTGSCKVNHLSNTLVHKWDKTSS